MIIAGDLGGTKTTLALYEVREGKLFQKHAVTYTSREHATFGEILRTFITDTKATTIKAGCFGVAGPVINGTCHTTNLPWKLDEKKLATEIQIPRIKLLNDLQATAYGMLFLQPDQLHVLQPGEPARQGNMAVIAAGTGLGEAILAWDGTHHHPLASEGGHADFAPHNELEIELLRYLREKFRGHVSYERVLSGPGLSNVYSYLRDWQSRPETIEIAAEMSKGDPNAVISKWGLARRDPLCTEALELFVSIYGAEAGNLALRSTASGVFIGGGIGPKILPALEWGGFLQAFRDKGRFEATMRETPVSVCLEPGTALLRRAHFGLRLAS